MAAVPITITGVICDLYGRTISGPVKIVGEAVITGLSVGGGPISPPNSEPPPVIWGGPIDPYPDHGLPQPPLRPTHPIVNPPERPPIDPPTEPPVNPPNPSWEWGWNPSTGWVPVFVPGDKPQPPS